MIRVRLTHRTGSRRRHRTDGKTNVLFEDAERAHPCRGTAAHNTRISDVPCDSCRWHRRRVDGSQVAVWCSNAARWRISSDYLCKSRRRTARGPFGHVPSACRTPQTAGGCTRSTESPADGRMLSEFPGQRTRCETSSRTVPCAALDPA